VMISMDPRPESERRRGHRYARDMRLNIAGACPLRVSLTLRGQHTWGTVRIAGWSPLAARLWQCYAMVVAKSRTRSSPAGGGCSIIRCSFRRFSDGRRSLHAGSAAYRCGGGAV